MGKPDARKMRAPLKTILAAGVVTAAGLAGWLTPHAVMPQTASTSLQQEQPADPPYSHERLLHRTDSVDLADMSELLEQTQTIADEQQRTMVRQALLDSWARRDAGTLGAWFGARRAADALHQDARDILALRLSQGDPAKVLPWMAASFSRNVRQEIYGPYFRELAKRDPSLAGAKVRELSQTANGDAMFYGDLAGQVAAQWAEVDLTRALSWATSLPESPAKASALLQMSPRWVRDDPVAAAAHAARSNDPALLQNVAVLWAQHDLPEAMGWAKALPDGEGRTAAISRLAGIWAQKSPEAALAFAMSIPDSDTRDLAAIEAVSSWASDQPEQAAQWVLQIPEGRLREEALGELIKTWAGHGAEAVDRWLQQLPPAPSRDVAVDTFCRLIDSTNPASAFRWAATISDETTRNRRLSEAALFWLEADNEAALVPISQSNLPASLRQRLLPDFQCPPGLSTN